MKPTILVAGAGPGISAAVARAFGAEGFRVALAARNPTRLAERCQELEAAGVDAAPFVADLADADARADLVARVRRWGGEPRALFYNAVGWQPGTADALNVVRERQALEVSLIGAVHLTSLLAPAMRAARAGSLLFTGGGAALAPHAGMASLCAGKAALRLWVLTLADDLRGTGIRVGTVTVNGAVAPSTAIDPGDIAAAFVRLHHGTSAGVEIHIP